MLVVRRQIKSVVHVVTASIRKSMGVFGYAKVWESSVMLKRYLVQRDFMKYYEIGLIMAREGLVVP